MSKDIHEMEERKRLEAEFHNRRERDRNTLDEDAFCEKYTNKKWYSTTRKSKDYLASWLNDNCQGKVVLDYCCGLGKTSLQMAESGAYVHGIDISSHSIETALKLLEENGYGGSVRMQVMDAENMEFADRTFDVIVCSGVLHHLNIKKAFNELSRVLKRDGKVICIEALGYNPVINVYRKLTPKIRTEWERNHILRMNDLKIAERYFADVAVEYFHLFSILGVFFRKRKYFTQILDLLDKMDSIALRLPGIRLMAWQMIIELKAPRKSPEQ